ncbi:prepilin-type N-terminal cleavage/methylation domain-containing protein [Actinoplanes bogorensis]|uniref:Prepilin-type N-terminal cleavage/methylation domain-containing protein n=1 Tax=Paractinoplanes bogorensis TaxID=1610840 RepID=A0ABS5YMN8_9ACTN|nr:prepilin-type N-terminal cleavage/methylation domain-containing protein [Actinoplanes bogorensis]MBU2664643.1 prepilin-type N-terminal cleavage/methylation domain-containing protein [Actinoplanes bogorensis]
MIEEKQEEERGDSGMTLIELLVGMGLMSVILVIVMGGLLEVYSSTNRVDSVTVARDQLTTSFRRLDKEIRYANWVATPGAVNGNWYLEYATSAGCRQLALKNGVLTTASWTLPSTTPGTPTTIGTNLALTGTTAPFTVYLPNSQPYLSASPGVSGVGRNYRLDHSQVRLRLTGKVGVTALPLDVLFTAQNTNGTNVFTDNGKLADNDCSKGRPTS